jgi:DNA-binding response OmpR family regulator
VFEERSAAIVSSEARTRAAQVFALPEILPAHTRIVLDVQARLTLLLTLNEGEAAPLVRSFQLTPSATRVFLALLQAYPQHCPYQTLFSALYPASQEAPSAVWEHYVRPIRRALRHLSPILRAFGLEVVALRGHGYLLTPAARFTVLPRKCRTVS